MDILICAATTAEIAPLIEFIENYQGAKAKPSHKVRVLVTGVGGIATTYNLMNSIYQQKPDYLIQAGIAGGFNIMDEIGKVVLIYEEIIGDMGAEEKDTWMDIFDLQLVENTFPFTEKKLINPDFSDWDKLGIPIVRALSVNEVTTNANRIEILRQKYFPVVESMEGAAFHYVCLQQKIPFMQIRAISNYIGERDKANWKMEEAIANLSEQLKRILLSFG